MSPGFLIILIVLILIILYFLYEPFRKWVKSFYTDAKDIVKKNKKEQELTEHQKQQLKQLKEKEEKLADLKQEEEMKLAEEQFVSEYNRLEQEIESVKKQIELEKTKSFEDEMYKIDTELTNFELSLRESEATERNKAEKCTDQNEYTESTTLSSGDLCEYTCMNYDTKTLKRIDKVDGICRIGNSCYYEHHKWSDLHQSCTQDYKLHIRTNKGECNIIIDDISYHITSSPIKIPIYIHRAGHYNDDQSKWGFDYTIEPITSNKMTNKICVMKNDVEERQKSQNYLQAVLMMPNNDWYKTTHIDWTIIHE